MEKYIEKNIFLSNNMSLELDFNDVSWAVIYEYQNTQNIYLF